MTRVDCQFPPFPLHLLSFLLFEVVKISHKITHQLPCHDSKSYLLQWFLQAQVKWQTWVVLSWWSYQFWSSLFLGPLVLLEKWWPISITILHQDHHLLLVLLGMLLWKTRGWCQQDLILFITGRQVGVGVWILLERSVLVCACWLEYFYFSRNLCALFSVGCFNMDFSAVTHKRSSFGDCFFLYLFNLSDSFLHELSVGFERKG